MVSSVDPYEVLGVKRDASQKEIRKSLSPPRQEAASRPQSRQPEAEQQFKEVTAAYDLLSDAEKRARFDRGEIDASGAERPRAPLLPRLRRGRLQPLHERCRLRRLRAADDILSEMFGRGGRAAPAPARRRTSATGSRSDFLDAVNGATKRLTLPDGSVLDVAIPPGHARRPGPAPARQGPARDPAAGRRATRWSRSRSGRIRYFTRQGDDIHLELPMSLAEAVLGAKVQVPTPTGPVTMTVPKWTNTGTSAAAARARACRAPTAGAATSTSRSRWCCPRGPIPSSSASSPAGRRARPTTRAKAMEA